MDTTANAELRTVYDARLARSRERLDWADGTLREAADAYEKARMGTASIDEVDELRFDREQAAITHARCQGDVDRLLDWRRHETGAPLP